MAVDLRSLNPQQRRAVTTVTGPVLVLAGAGSGKTRVITYRIAHLVVDHGAAASSILAVSFTNKAAGEMRARVRGLMPDAPRGPAGALLCTFHALGLRILREDAAALGYTSRLVVYDAADQLSVVRHVMRELKVDEKVFDPRRIQALIGMAKNRLETPETMRLTRGDDDEIMAARIYGPYQAALRAYGAVDFDDLILLPVRLFREAPAATLKWQTRFRHLMVDEYQDTNRAQLELARHLAAVHRNICVVGDDDQSIYGWRGAEVRNILEFERHFEGATVVTLEENYRSTTTILDAANAVIGHNPSRRPKRLWSRLGRGEPVDVLVCADDVAEASEVVHRILEMRMRHQVPYEQIAVLYRTNHQARPIEQELMGRRVPYHVVGGQRFFDRKEIKDFVSYLRAVLVPSDEASLRRIINYPARGIGRTTVERLTEWCLSTGRTFHDALAQGARDAELTGRAREAVADFVALLGRWRAQLAATAPGGGRLAGAAQTLLRDTGLKAAIQAEARNHAEAQRRAEALEDLVRAIGQFEDRSADDPDADRGLGGFLDQITLDDREEDRDTTGAGVTLMTLHAAKGLEFPHVFMVGMEDGLMPLQRQGEAFADLDEERRLCYVGITRAQRKLVITRAQVRRRYGKEEMPPPSRFLAELPPEALREHDLTGEARARGGRNEADAIDDYRKNLLALVGRG